MAQNISEGDTVEVKYEDSERNFVGEYKGVKQRSHGKVHVVHRFKQEADVEIPVNSESEKVTEYSVI